MSEQEMLPNETENEVAAEPVVAESGVPAREAQDHLPIKPSWKVILSGIVNAAFCFLMAAIVISSLTAEGRITGIGWFIIIVFILGTFAAGYSSFDEFRHLKAALALDKGGKLESVPIVDDWKDNYVDGGIATRKETYHIIYLYADGKEYAKHSISKSAAQAFKTNVKIKVQYLPEDPKIFRPILGEQI